MHCLWLFLPLHLLLCNLQEGAAEEGADQHPQLLEEEAAEEGDHHVRRQLTEEGEEGEEGELLAVPACMQELVVLIVVEGEA